MKFTFLDSRRSGFSLQSRWLLILSALWLAVPMNLALWRYILTHLEINSFRTGFFAVSFPILVFAVVYLLLNIFAIPWVTKPLLAAAFLISAFANYVMYNLGIRIDAVMIQNVFETNPRETMDLITFSLILWVGLGGVLPAILLARAKIIYRPFWGEVKWRAIMAFLCILIIAGIAAVSFKNYASFGRNHSSIRNLISPTNYVASTLSYFKRQALARRQFAMLDINAKLARFEDPYPTVIVIIVGETARAMNFSLNGYDKPTNPRLAKERLLNFPDTWSCGTSTGISVPCMFSANPRSKFKAENEKKTQNLLDILQLAGYNILWLENDNGCKGVCDRVPTKEFDPKKNSKWCDGKSCFDEVMLEDLEQRLLTITKDTVIVLHTIGSHGPTYYQRYPDSFKKFKPTCDTADIQSCTREQITNTYDNTILYTDHVVAETIAILKRFPYFESGLLYVSDHGESLGENNLYLHGMPYAIAPDEQKKVPMTLWMSDNMIKYDHLDYACLQKEVAKNTYSHDNFFHSILGLAEVSTKLYDKKLDIFTPCRLKPLPKCDNEAVKCD